MKDLSFRFPWRQYQQRVLDEMQAHFDDGKLHIVAAPGSGKTVLGLEVMRRIGKKTLILAPTVTIRNQWAERLAMFLPEDAPSPDWVSFDIKKPGLVTVATYQALHAAFAGEDAESDAESPEEEEEEKTAAETAKKKKKNKAVDIVALMKRHKLKLLVLDEAHHLRNEWWRALTRLCEGMDEGMEGVKIVSLTATPPYDVDEAEWQRYERLCGPIDAEISVPELVLQGDLCPHQDYVYFSLPRGRESEVLQNFRADIEKLLEHIRLDPDFLSVFAAHPWVNDTGNRVEDILDDPAFFSSMIIFMNAANIRPPRIALEILGTRRKDIPLLTGMLYTHAEDFALHEKILAELRRNLQRIGAIEHRRVMLDNTRSLRQLLAGSLGKIESIVTIARTEADNLGEDLRLVVLADYIRREELPNAPGEEKDAAKIGVIPIFEMLRRARISGMKPAVLTGSVMIIPAAAKKALERAAKDSGIGKDALRFYPLVHDDAFLRIELSGQSRSRIVHMVTEIFGQGDINALVGTQALLGEGWDAPSINALILASHVGSFMLSNQMRGRAIRTDPARPDKTANIWHLAAADIENFEDRIRGFFNPRRNQQPRGIDLFDEIRQDLGHDVFVLRRRFRAFEGLSFTDPPVIENGFKRLNLAKAVWTESGVADTNKKMLRHAAARNRLAQLWKTALEGASPKPEIRHKTESNYAPRGLAFADTIKYLIINALIGGGFFGLQTLQGQGSNWQQILFVLMFACGIAFVVALPRLLRALWLLLRNGSIEKSVRQAGLAVLDTLCEIHAVNTARTALDVKAVRDSLGVVYCRIDGAQPEERRIFLAAMQELLGPVANPRYLMVRESLLGRLLRVDYHPVPTVIGRNKKSAEYFARRWQRYLGGGTLVYTRNREGRMTLLKARTRALSAAFQKKTDRISIWE